ncbi:hypothetical protein LSAT2_000984 [Lamellibrachia satsuma]|nr:hypothetical protein LSAT2_000984 [Lamellibrachia satsuma]
MCIGYIYCTGTGHSELLSVSYKTWEVVSATASEVASSASGLKRCTKGRRPAFDKEPYAASMTTQTMSSGDPNTGEF